MSLFISSFTIRIPRIFLKVKNRVNLYFDVPFTSVIWRITITLSHTPKAFANDFLHIALPLFLQVV